MNTNEEKMNAKELSDEELTAVTGGMDFYRAVEALGKDLSTRSEFKKAYVAYQRRDWKVFFDEVWRLIKQGNTVALKAKDYLLR